MTDDAATAGLPILIKERATQFQGKWLKLDKVDFVNKINNKPGVYEVVSRCSRPEGSAVDGVTIVAWLLSADDSPRIILIRQFRVPLLAHCIEFPAGLIDPDETIEEAALRELKEETGYTADAVLSITPGSAPLDPGLGNSDIQFATVHVDGDRAENREPKQQLDGTEQIEVVLVQADELEDRLKKWAAEGDHIEATVWAYWLGLQATKNVPGL